jgi:uncharacterized iron-regulated membrane protein
MTSLERWIRQPQTVWLRKAIFQLHLWSGIGFGLYVFFVSVTGSVLVYRNELFRATTRDPVVVAESGARLSDEQLKIAATRLYPGYRVQSISLPRKPNQAVSLSLQSGTDTKNRFFDPYTGADLGESVPLGFRLVSKLILLHDELLAGSTGRSVNGVGAVLVVVLAFTGIVVWWPGIRAWRRSLILPRNVGWQRFIWSLHSMVGFWGLGVVLLFAVSGAYLCDPEPFDRFADWIQPVTEANMRSRLADRVIYWLAYLHFGRVNGIGIPCSGPGLCDQTTKAAWAFFGLTPAIMFVTGAMMWWNRVVRRKLRRSSRAEVNAPSSLN